MELNGLQSDRVGAADVYLFSCRLGRGVTKVAWKLMKLTWDKLKWVFTLIL